MDTKIDIEEAENIFEDFMVALEKEVLETVVQKTKKNGLMTKKDLYNSVRDSTLDMVQHHLAGFFESDKESSDSENFDDDQIFH